MSAAGVTVVGEDEKGNPKFNGPFRLIIINPATKHRVYYQSYEWALGAAEWQTMVCSRIGNAK